MTDLTLDKVRDALVLSLAVDGYIDIEGHYGEDYLYGDASRYSINAIDGVAESLHKFLTMDPAAREAHRSEVLGRRKAEGRD